MTTPEVPDFEGEEIPVQAPPGELLVHRELYLPAGHIVSLSTINKEAVAVDVYGDRASWFDPDHEEANPETGMLTVHKTVINLELRWEEEETRTRSLANLSKWRDEGANVKVVASVQHQAILVYLADAEEANDDTVVGVKLGQDRMDSV